MSEERVPRRSFLRGLGALAAVAILTPVGFEPPPREVLAAGGLAVSDLVAMLKDLYREEFVRDWVPRTRLCPLFYRGGAALTAGLQDEINKLVESMHA